MRKVWTFFLTLLMAAFVLRLVLASVEQAWRAVEPALPFVAPALLVILIAVYWYRRSSRW